MLGHGWGSRPGGAAGPPVSDPDRSGGEVATEEARDRAAPVEATRDGTGVPDGLGDDVWVVLGGGGLKGLAHIGAWRAFEEAGLAVRGIVGTSIGALVGVCLAGGMRWDEMMSVARELERQDIVKIARRAVWINGVRAPSLYRGEVLRDYIASVLPVREWSELRFPVQLNAVDLGSGRTVWFGPGARTDVPPLDAVCASASLPVLYPPVHLEGRHYVDGGAGDALPLDRAAALGASGLVAVDVGAEQQVDGHAVVERGMVAIHQRVFSLMAGRRRREAVQRWEEPPLLYVRPDLVGHTVFDFDAVEYFLDEGYLAARRTLRAGSEGR